MKQNGPFYWLFLIIKYHELLTYTLDMNFYYRNIMGELFYCVYPIKFWYQQTKINK